MTKQFITSQLSIIDYEINDIQEQLKSLPKGKLSFYQSGKYIRWVHIINNQKVPIPKKERDFAHQILLQEYLSNKLSDLYFERSQLQECLRLLASQQSFECSFWKKKHINTFWNSDTSRSSNFNINESSMSLTSEQSISAWNDFPYIKNNNHPEQLIYPSISGNKLRSKSEVIIDQTMYFNKIDYRYECRICLDGIDLYPDFIALSSTNQLIIWEHLGMMDEPNYVNNAIHKINLYIRNGYIPGINLILTSETNQIPLNPLLVNDLVQRFLL